MYEGLRGYPQRSPVACSKQIGPTVMIMSQGLTLELEKRKVSKMSRLRWRYFGWGGGWYFESVGGAVGFYRCPYAIYDRE